MLACLGSLLVASGLSAAPAVVPNDLLVATTRLCDCEEIALPEMRALDPSSGASRGLLVDFVGGDFTHIGAGLDGSVAALGTLSGRVHYLDANGQPVSLLPPSQVHALEAHGDILFADAGYLQRYRVLLGDFKLVSRGDFIDVKTGPAGEVFVLTEDESVERVDLLNGSRSVVAGAGFATEIAVEPSGNVVGLRDGSVVRVDVATGQQTVVAPDVAPPGAHLGVVGDGTIFVGVGESSPGAADGLLVRIDPSNGAPSSQLVDFAIESLTALVGVHCNEVAGACVPPPVIPECAVSGDCNDGLFCTSEVCDGEVCRYGPPTCLGGYCNEDADICFECFSAAQCDDSLFCTNDLCQDGQCEHGPTTCAGGLCDEERDRCSACSETSECDDGVFCNGIETCEAGVCVGPALPVCPQGQICAHDIDACRVPLDMDLVKIQVPNRHRLSKGKPVTLKLRARNAGSSNGTVSVRIVATLGGATLFDETAHVFSGKAGRYSSSAVVSPSVAGELVWTVTVADEDPDLDLETRSTLVTE